MNKSLKSVAGITGTYTRGQASVSVTVVPGRTQAEVAQGALMVKLDVRDWIVRASELVLANAQAEPKPGDRLSVNGRLYEVMQRSTGVPPWQWSDPYNQVYRIHTKDVGAAQA
jgi:hypothetical protein